MVTGKHSKGQWVPVLPAQQPVPPDRDLHVTDGSRATSVFSSSSDRNPSAKGKGDQPNTKGGGKDKGREGKSQPKGKGGKSQPKGKSHHEQEWRSNRSWGGHKGGR